ncbi:MAG: hypothetical protein P9L91_06445, partial [Candidatus Zophobacter franzmannii]|nr:hypothetical protein [Candidatus Zophobacter franzmannii]
MKKTLVVLLLVLVAFGLVAQQGQYVRKSVSSVESIWMKAGSGYMNDTERDFFDRMFKFYVEIPRFDFNSLPASVKADFVTEANKIDAVSPAALGGVMERTVAVKIAEILNDGDLQKKRADGGFKDEASMMSFAATKGKSLGLSGDELAAFMNSAYIYLPFVSSVVEVEKQNEKTKKNYYTYTINGGILWYKVNVAPDGKVSIKQVKSATTKTFDTKEVTTKKATFKFGEFNQSVDYKTNAKYNAMLAFAKNLGVKTKQIDDFKLQAQVVSIEKGKLAGDIGHKEGVHLDDGYYICEPTETADGKTKFVKKGFTRVWKTGKNKNDPSANSLFYKHYGNGDIGMVLMEHPRLGIDLQFTVSMLTGMNIEKNIKIESDVIDEFKDEAILEEDLSSALILDFKLMNNVASVFNSRQLFFEVGLYVGAPDIEKIQVASGQVKHDDIKTTFGGLYIGATKKFWMRRLGFTFDTQVSYAILTLDFGDDSAA